MSVALALYCFSCRLEGVQALPVTVARRATSSCDDLSNCRTSSHIIWSCLATIFSCTWFAIHPNIPAPYESSLEVGLRRFGVFVMALIAPELVIMWAMKQWIASRRLAKKYHAKEWTQTHGFFAIMGGFMLVSGDKALHTLLPEELDELHTKGKIVFPRITEREILDKSKGDMISKAFVILQTSWFVLQCIARGVERLAITELELVTLAFAVLNLATYAFWWHKPQNVRRPFAVRLFNESPDQAVKGEEVPGMFNRAIDSIVHAWGGHYMDKMFLPLSPFGSMIVGGNFKRGATKVPSFFAGDTNENDDDMWPAALASATIATIFGALHCIAWSFQYPSHEIAILWRTCSLLITCLPFTLVFCAKLTAILDNLIGEHNIDGIVYGIVCIPFFAAMAVLIVSPFIYVAARVTLLVEAFLLLKTHHPDVFQVIQWTNFIPHV
ncbi:hypothetical protein BD410DRAFT_902936 [Rickenella mellea]|uniref:Uncharacterized protein n=1 Tax=Rickenella mellea TaxID=50990 RepID=A0A4Y7PI84_9AGAM|nr:hypothetical protein BD410DRAFT_902936 [Rickenella mellea]